MSVPLFARLLTTLALRQLGQLLLDARTYALGPAALAALAVALFAAAAEHVRRRLEFCRLALSEALGGGPMEAGLETVVTECIRMRLAVIVPVDEASTQVPLLPNALSCWVARQRMHNRTCLPTYPHQLVGGWGRSSSSYRALTW